MNLNSRFRAAGFFELGSNNIIINLGITLTCIFLFPKTGKLDLIPILFIYNLIWAGAYALTNFRRNEGLLFYTIRGRWLLLQLMVSFSITSLQWLPSVSAGFFMGANIVFCVAVLTLYAFRKQCSNIIAKTFYGSAGQTYFQTFSKVRRYVASNIPLYYYQPSLAAPYSKHTGVMPRSYNHSRMAINTVLATSLQAETEIQKELEHAEYTFGSVNFGDTIANWATTLPYRAKYKKVLPVRQLDNRIIKRSFDIVVSLVVIVFFLSWMIPVIGLLIKLESRGPVFFSQFRSGLHNAPFMCLKFRSMYVNETSDRLQATRGDSRITKIGAFLRKTSLDEFPQFINVLKGEMSIVGPRPHMLMHTEIYSTQVNNYMGRLQIKQGLTGLAQVRGYRGETTDVGQMAKRVEYDLWYLNNWSLWLDLKIIIHTAFQVFKGPEGAR